VLSNVTIKENIATWFGGGIEFLNSGATFDTLNRCNIFFNYAGDELGADLYSFQDNPIINAVVDTFTVMYPTEKYAFPLNKFTFDILNYKISQVTANLYVDPAGDNNNSGITPSEPLQTITYALELIYADSLNPCTIYLAEGIYSPSTNGEVFPLNCKSFVSFSGAAEQTTILDAQGTDGIFKCDSTKNISIEKITLQNGSDRGIDCINSNLSLEHLTIKGNDGGISIVKSTNPTLSNITIKENITNRNGSGMSIVESPNTILSNVTIKDNITNGNGGGIYLKQNSDIQIIDVTVNDNVAFNKGGGIYCERSNAYFKNVIIQQSSANDGAGIYFEQNSDIQLIDITIKDNVASNNGGGIYFEQNSDIELFSVKINDNSTTNKGGGIFCANSNLYLNSVIIQKDSADSGGGIYCDSSDISLKNTIIQQDSAIGSGGGISCNASNLLLDKVILAENKARKGAGIHCYQSNPILINITMNQNIASNTGGGLYIMIDSDPVLINSILWNNMPQEIRLRGGGNSVTITYCDIKGGVSGIYGSGVNWLSGNKEQDPLFIGGSPFNFNLTQNSPCVDAGTALFVWQGDTIINLPDTSYFSYAPDMGALESQYVSNINFAEDVLPKNFALYQNYPNPFNPVTKIKYDLPTKSDVKLIIYDLLGRKVRILVNRSQLPGQKIAIWDALDDHGFKVASGLYIYKIVAGDYVKSRKMLLMK